jgi:hypothetical protein
MASISRDRVSLSSHPLMVRPASGLCAWTPVADPLRPPSLSTSLGLPASRAYTRSTARLRSCAPSTWWARPAVAFPTPVRPRPQPPSNPTFPSLSCVRSADLLRLAPPGVYLEGSRLPLESPADGTTGFAEPGPGDVLRTTGASGSVFSLPPLPSGGSAVRLSPSAPRFVRGRSRPRTRPSPA